MEAETQFTANTGMVTMTSGNNKLDGSGTIYKVLTAAANGTLIKSITIKAQGYTKEGMVRLFVMRGAKISLFAEIEVQEINPTGTVPSFEYYLPLDLKLASGDTLWASTQNGDTINVIAEGLDWTYYSTLRISDPALYFANTGINSISTANPNRDGTGAIVAILTASGSGYNGCNLSSITVKGEKLNGVTEGMVRLYIQDTSANIILFSEIPIASTIQTATQRSFIEQINFDSKKSIQSGYSICASTENAELFGITIDAEDWNYYP